MFPREKCIYHTTKVMSWKVQTLQYIEGSTYIYIINKKPRDWNMLRYCTTDSLYHCTNTTCNELEVKQFFFFITVEAHQNSAVFKPNQISLAFNYVIL